MAGNSDFLTQVPPFLTDGKDEFCRVSEQETHRGKYRNLSVRIKENVVFITGSLCKFYYGDNLQVLDRVRTKDAIMMLSDGLHIPVYDAKVLRIDVGMNLLMNYEVPYYFPFLGQSPPLDRLEQNNGIYYRGCKGGILLYDKLAEHKLKGGDIPEVLNESNLLRIESKFNRRIYQQFNVPEVKASALYDREFYKKIIKRCGDNYFNINKYKVPNIKFNYTKMKYFDKQIWLIAINAVGGEEKMIRIIEQARRKGEFTSRTKVKRYKDKIREVCTTPQLSFESPQIIELDEKVREAVNRNIQLL